MIPDVNGGWKLDAGSTALAAGLAVDEAGDRRGLLVVVTQEFGVKLGGASPGGDERHKGRRRTSTQDIFEAVAVKACLPQKKTSLTQVKKGFQAFFFVKGN